VCVCVCVCVWIGSLGQIASKLKSDEKLRRTAVITFETLKPCGAGAGGPAHVGSKLETLGGCLHQWCASPLPSLYLILSLSLSLLFFCICRKLKTELVGHTDKIKNLRIIVDSGALFKDQPVQVRLSLLYFILRCV
jgi:hypothetical protein